MGKQWTTRRRGDEKAFLRSLHKGKTVYVINTPQHAGHARIWNHAQTWSAHTVTGKHPILGGWIFDGSPSNGAVSFFKWAGTVYEDQPRGIPHASDPGPRVAGPLPAGEEFDRVLDAGGQELKQMEYWRDEANERRAADLKSGRRKWF
ncbi:hypothetical protein [Streptomyces katrae]|uniref:hypothetical protein n=1 Tax=Streptomyces katrae TaxID=68223 RepID=UPI000AACBFDD|nr:hypothetical protein [Streptomyces katrae]